MTWRMNPRAKVYNRAWDFLRYEIAPDIALVQDALPPDELGEDEYFVYPKTKEINGKTGGSGIWARGTVEQLKIDTAFSRRLIGARVSLLKWPHQLYVISMYGRYREKSLVAPNLHRMISDLHPVLVAHKGRIILGGDWYADPKYNEKYPFISPLHRLVFERLEDRYYGLRRCNKKALKTFYHPSGCSFQNDYLYASKYLLWWRMKCDTVAYPKGYWFSDHLPVLAEFRV